MTPNHGPEEGFWPCVPVGSAEGWKLPGKQGVLHSRAGASRKSTEKSLLAWEGPVLSTVGTGDIQEIATMGMDSSQIFLELPFLATDRSRDWARRTHFRCVIHLHPQ